MDFFHASNWQDVRVTRSVYDEMRCAGLPRTREVVNAVEAFYTRNEAQAEALEPLDYRKLVRQLIPVAVHRIYWEACHQLTESGDRFNADCAQGVPDDVMIAALSRIADDPRIEPTLTGWTGYTATLGDSLNETVALGNLAIATADEELRK